ncbi:MAG: RNA-binding domain-containing protein [Victivallales bacterium]
MTESNRIEYKQELTDLFEKEVVAFLNSHEGGVIYIGIDNSGKVIGLDDSDADQLKIKDRLKNNIQPSCLGLFDVVHEKRESRDIVKVIVAGGLEKPYYIKKYGMSERGCFIRIGSASDPMPEEMIESLYSKRVRNTIGKMSSPRQDLTFEQLFIYYEAKGLKLNDAFMKNLELLTPEDKPNYAAYLLADENGMSLQVAKYAGTDRVTLVENKDYGRCSIIKALKAVLDRVNVENTVFARIGYPLREEREMIDSTAIREAIINAVVHNDYSFGATPKIEFFVDRVEITSMGGLPYGVDKEDFFSGFSVPRNKELMRVFRDLEIVEQLGSGIPRILRKYGKEAFEIRKTLLRVTMPYAKAFEAGKLPTKVVYQTGGMPGLKVGEIAGGQMGGQMGGQIGGQMDLTKRELEVLAIIEQDNRVTRKSLAQTLGINESAVSKHLDNLKKKGLVKRMGRTRGHWELLDK